MSSGSITISYTTLAEIAVAAAVIGGVAFIGSKQISSSSTSPIPAQGGGSSKNAIKNKKKRASTANGQIPSVGEVQEKVEHVANQVKEGVQNGIKTVQENESVKKGVEQVKQAANDVANKVEEVKQDGVNAVGSTTTTTKNKKKKNKGGNKTPPTQQPEKKENKKGDDMRDYELEPEHPPARVMKIVGGDIGADPATIGKGNGDEWEKAEAFEDNDGEWDTVVSKKPSRPSTPSISTLASSQPARSIPGLAAPQTKKQRENALKKAKEDAAKREKDEEQERRLKAHRDTLNRARAQEAALAKRPKPSSQNYFGNDVTPPAKQVNGNLHAGLDPTSDGSLVWD
ncbi:hypothetical protein JCM16303_006657 [Sporobolomyces ruberrimus]